MRHLLLAILLAACGTDIVLDGPDAGNLPNPDGYTKLISGDWTLAPSSEKYVCIRQTVTADMYLKAIRPIAPLGTHHTVLMLGPADKPDGIEDCDSSLIKPAIYASGVGTQPLTMPDGVAVHLKQGDQLLLNLHLFNADDAPLSGTSGMEILDTDPVDAMHQAGVVLVGKSVGLVVPTGTSTQTGTCTTPAGTTVFAVAPHMHLLGTHMKVAYQGATVIDQDYSFDGQRFDVLAQSIATVASGKLVVDCTYANYTGSTVYFGEHTQDEMCFALTFVYPAPAADQCTH